MAGPSSSGGPSAQLLDTRGVQVFGTTVTAELWRLPNALGGSTYAQWMAPNGTTARPAVILTRPYDGIDWTGEAVDERWASRPGAATTGYFHDDDEEPSFTPGGSQISYRVSSVQEVANDAANILFNQMGVLAVFGRFYTGGSVEDDVQDMVAGTVFLQTHPRVIPDRVGIFGGSWGGFEALYGAAYAPLGAQPMVGVALFPAADFEALTQWVQTGVFAATTLPARQDQFRAFYDPYLRRILATVGTGPAQDFTGYRAVDLVTRAPIPWLVVHDSWDLLIPFAFSQALVAADPVHVNPLWYRHDQPVNQDTMAMDHGPLGAPTVMAAYQTFALAFLELALEPGPSTTVAIPYGAQDLANHLLETRVQQAAGADVSFVVERLLQLCDPRLLMVDMTPQNPLPQMNGRALVAGGINAVWGTTLTEATVEAQLTTTGLPPP